jgi:phosphohistidine phosphatase
MTIHSHHRLLIMRHGKSDWNAGAGRDFDRPLAERGSRDARKVGRWLSGQNLNVETIISSPALRARATAILVAGELGMDAGAIHWEEDIYEAAPSVLLAVVGRCAESNSNILLIGHNPGLDSVLCYLAREEPDRTPSGKLLTTSALAILDYGAAAVSVRPHSAHLEKLVRPKQLP